MRSQSYASSSSRAASSGSTFFETLLDSTHLHVNQQNGPELLCISITQRQIRSLSFDISPQGTDISTRSSPFVGCIVLSRVVKDEFRFLVAFIVHCRSNFTSDSSGSLTFLGETIDYKMTRDPFAKRFGQSFLSGRRVEDSSTVGSERILLDLYCIGALHR